MYIPYTCVVLFSCAVIGCRRADLPTVPGATLNVATDGRTAVVECGRGQGAAAGHVRWSLECVDDKWTGSVGNCTRAAVADGRKMLSVTRFG